MLNSSRGGSLLSFSPEENKTQWPKTHSFLESQPPHSTHISWESTWYSSFNACPSWVLNCLGRHSLRPLAWKRSGTYYQKAISFAYPRCKNKLRKQWGWGETFKLFSFSRKAEVNPRKEVWTYKDVAFPQDLVGIHWFDLQQLRVASVLGVFRSSWHGDYFPLECSAPNTRTPSGRGKGRNTVSEPRMWTRKFLSTALI